MENIFSSFFNDKLYKNIENDEDRKQARNNNFTEDIDTYLLRNDKGEETKILCDTVRIYHPAHKSHQKYVIYFDNIVNGIHVHYFCISNENLKTHSETEFRINNSIYSEFIEFDIPNIDYLFGDNVYYNENVNYWEYNGQTNVDSDTYCPLRYLLYNYKLEYNESENSYVKKYVNYFVTGQPFQLQINCTLYPYSYIDTNKIFILDPDSEANSDSFVNDINIKLAGNLSFNDGKLTAQGSFIYSNNDKLDESKSIQDIYCSLLRFNLADYRTEIPEDGTKYDIPIENIKTPIIMHDIVYDIEVNLNSPYGIIDNYDGLDYSGETKYYTKNDEDDVYNNLFTPVDTEYVKENAGEVAFYTLGSEPNGIPGYCFLDDFFKYIIEIASDPGFTQIVYYNSIFVDTVDNFNFSLDGIFERWEQLPECLVVRLTFVDLLNSISLESNIIPITKEKFKYLICDNVKNRINLNNMSDTNFKFIDKINCIIKTEVKQENVISTNNNTGSAPIVLYKPIFYRVSTAQNIQIRNGVQQNIGINLSNYMTKVNTFKLQLDNKEYIEYARNDVYVIFRINGNELEDIEGLYNIMNEDDEYITYGAWTVI